jgi:hypothetical protein
MTDSNGIASPKAEESKVEEDSGLISFGDIAEAAGVESSFFESANSEEPEAEQEQVSVEEKATEDVEETEEVEATEEVVEEVEEPVENLSNELSVEDEPQDQSEDSAGVKKRIGKLIEARNKAEAEVEELRAKLEEAQGQPTQAPDPKGMDRFDSVKDFKELQTREAEAEHLREWLLANPDGGDYKDITGTEHEVDYESARRLMVETDRDLRKNIPLASQRLQQREQNKQTAMQTFDWMKDQASPEMQEIKQVLDQNKFIKEYYEKDPFSVLTVAYAIEGIKAINAKKAQKPTKPSVAPRVPSVPSRATPSVVKKKSTSKKTLLQQASSGSVEDASSYIESLL